MQLRLDEAYKQNRKGLLEFIRSKVGRREEAEDILQDVFTRAVLNANTLVFVDDIAAWLFVSVRNKITDWYRSRKRTTHPFTDRETEDFRFEELIVDTDLNVEGEFLRSVVAEAVENAIDDLPEDQREVIVRTMIEGLTFRELAQETGVSINTLLARKRYGVAKLRETLKEIKTVLDQYNTEGRL